MYSHLCHGPVGSRLSSSYYDDQSCHERLRSTALEDSNRAFSQCQSCGAIFQCRVHSCTMPFSIVSVHSLFQHIYYPLSFGTTTFSAPETPPTPPQPPNRSSPTKPPRILSCPQRPNLSTTHAPMCSHPTIYPAPLHLGLLFCDFYYIVPSPPHYLPPASWQTGPESCCL